MEQIIEAPIASSYIQWLLPTASVLPVTARVYESAGKEAAGHSRLIRDAIISLCVLTRGQNPRPAVPNLAALDARSTARRTVRVGRS